MFVLVLMIKQGDSRSSQAQQCFHFLKNPPPLLICVHILHDNTLTSENRDKFSRLAKHYDQVVKFYNVEELCADRITELRKYLLRKVDTPSFTVGAFYRLFIPFVLPTNIEKAIYLDCDIIVNLNVNELWEIDLGDKSLGIVNAWQSSLHGIVKKEDYFNNGVMSMNLKILRKEEEIIKDGLKFFSENPQHCRWPDQDLFNYCFATRALKLPAKFNCQTGAGFERKRHAPFEEKIYHYLGKSQALYMDMSDPFNKLWMSYFIRTPWFEVETIGRLYEGFKQIRNDLLNSATNLSAVVAGRTRVFFADVSKVELVKKVFSVHDDETIILAENEESIQKLIDAMRISRDKCVFFIMMAKFLNKNFPFDLLTKEGFVEKKHFVKGWKFLSEVNDEKIFSHDLIRQM